MGPFALQLRTSLLALLLASACTTGTSAPDSTGPTPAPAPDADADADANADADAGPAAGLGPPSIVAQLTGNPGDMHVDPSGIYVTAWDPSSPQPPKNNLFRVPPGGGNAQVLAHDFWLGAIVADVDAVYVSAGPKVGNGPGRILRIAKADWSLTEFTTSCTAGGMIGSLALDASNVYFGCEDAYIGPSTGTPGFIGRMPKTGGTPETMVPGVFNPESILVSGDTMFFSEGGGGSVQSCALEGCPATATMLAPSQWHPRGLSLVGTNLVWGSGDATNHDLAWSMPLDGSHAATALCPVPWIGWFAADESGIYWSVYSNIPGSGRLSRASLDGRTTDILQDALPSGGPIALTTDAVFHASVDSNGWVITVWEFPKR
jgi:hypothetical protein